MALPPEKISELKQVIRDQLSKVNIQSHLSQALQGEDEVSEDRIINNLRNQGVIEELMKNIHFESTNDDELPAVIGEHPKKKASRFVDQEEKLLSADTVKKANIDPTRRYLYLQFLGGKAFLEHLQENNRGDLVSSTLTLHVHFRGQRFKSRPVPCACEPAIQEGFMLELHKESAGEAARMADTTSLLGMPDLIHIVLVKCDSSGERHLVASDLLQWRTVMAAPSSRTSLALELKGVGNEHQVTVGILDLKMELVPKLDEPMSENIISTQLALEKSRNAERERLFLVYAKQWWKEYLQIRQDHRDRFVKIFAQDENGIKRPVTMYVQPLRAGRLLKSPRLACRFVSLIGYEKVLNLGGGRNEQWSSTFAFLCRNKGDCEDHALLLCNLLLGFGMDAYMCVGTKAKGVAHAWVMTIGTDGVVTFWESLTGHRYIHEPYNPNDPPSVPRPRPQHLYRTVGCVFNHECFFANCQSSDIVETCVFDLYNQARWKPMSEDALRSVSMEGPNPTWPALPPLVANPIDPAMASNDLEIQIRNLVVLHRQDQGLGTTWDDHLSYILTPALASYEAERATGVAAGNEEFQQSVRRAVPEGHTFKGFPVQVIHRNPRMIFKCCLENDIGSEIINCRGDHVRLAVRVDVVTYPENAVATWVMLACKYKSVL